MSHVPPLRGPDRRSVIGFALGALLAGPRARAQALAETRVGAWSVATLSDGALQLGPAAGLAPDAEPAEVAALFAEGGLDANEIRPPLNVTMLRGEGRTVLFDAGSGGRFQPTAGRLLAALEGAGVAAGDVTDVVFTHAHPDHLWGALDDFDEIAFPEAAFHMGRIEWDFWRSAGAAAAVGAEREAFVVGALARFAAIEPRLTLIDAEAEVLPGIEAVATHGHTPGHLSFAVHGGDGLFVAGDALAHPLLSFRRPDWRSAMDQDGVAAAATRRSLLDRLAHDGMRVVGYHLPEPGLGRVERDGTAWRWSA